MFPALFKSKFSSSCSDVVIVDESDGEPIFNLILDIETLAKFCTFLDFREKTIKIDHIRIATRSYKILAWKTNMSNKAFQMDDAVHNNKSTFSRDHLEPIGLQEATKHII